MNVADSASSSRDSLLRKIELLEEVVRKKDAKIKTLQQKAARKRKSASRRPPQRPDAH